MIDINEILHSKYFDEYSILMNLMGTQTDSVLDSDQIENLLYMAIDRAAKTIMRYTGWTEIQSGYESVISSLALAYLKSDTQAARLVTDKPFIAAQTQGSRSATYKADMTIFDCDGLTAEIKAALPFPTLKVFD